jgi:AcrR family transcriptional regulator
MPGKEDAAARREQIHQAALTCFLRKGYHRATMDDIVAESGLSKGTLYWYFNTKKDLFLSLFQEFLGQMDEEWHLIVENQEMSATDKLRYIVDLFRAELEEMAPFFGIMMEAWILTRQDETIQETVHNLYQMYLDIMTDIFEEGVASGEFQAESAEAAALVIMMLYDGMALARGLDLVVFDWDKVLDAAGTIVLRGLGIKASDDQE